MLIGEYQHNIDSKGRVAIPSKFRDDLGMRFYITKGLDDCLFVLGQKEWDNLENKIKSMPMSKARGVQRFFFSGACEVVPDKQGRILIPQKLREYASLNKEVTLTGASNRVEIWDSNKWDSFNLDLTQESIAQVMDMLEL